MARHKKQFILFLVLSILVLLFIFYNSTRNGEQSNNLSQGFMHTLLSLIDPNGKLDTEIVHFLIRKGAHFTEFAVLGGLLCAMMNALFKMKSVFYKSMMFLICLFSAVTDELIQSFNTRTSSVRDVLLDFAGAACGILIVRLILKGTQKRKNPEIY